MAHRFCGRKDCLGVGRESCIGKTLCVNEECGWVGKRKDTNHIRIPIPSIDEGEGDTECEDLCPKCGALVIKGEER